MEKVEDGRVKSQSPSDSDLGVKRENLGNADAALEYLANEDTAIMSEIDEKKLVWKIDWMVCVSRASGGSEQQLTDITDHAADVALVRQLQDHCSGCV